MLWQMFLTYHGGHHSQKPGDWGGVDQSIGNYEILSVLLSTCTSLWRESYTLLRYSEDKVLPVWVLMEWGVMGTDIWLLHRSFVQRWIQERPVRQTEECTLLVSVLYSSITIFSMKDKRQEQGSLRNKVESVSRIMAQTQGQCGGGAQASVFTSAYSEWHEAMPECLNLPLNLCASVLVDGIKDWSHQGDKDRIDQAMKLHWILRFLWTISILQ